MYLSLLRLWKTNNLRVSSLSRDVSPQHRCEHQKPPCGTRQGRLFFASVANSFFACSHNNGPTSALTTDWTLFLPVSLRSSATSASPKASNPMLMSRRKGEARDAVKLQGWVKLQCPIVSQPSSQIPLVRNPRPHLESQEWDLKQLPLSPAAVRRNRLTSEESRAVWTSAFQERNWSRPHRCCLAGSCRQPWRNDETGS